MSYEQRNLEFIFSMDGGQFDDNGTDEIRITNVKSVVRLGAYLGLEGLTGEFSLFGLSLELLAMLSARGLGVFTNRSDRFRVKIKYKESIIFQGGIVSAWADMNTTPEPALNLQAVAALDAMKMASQAYSQPGIVKIADMLTAITSTAGIGLALNDIGDITSRPNPHYEGSPYEQLTRICFAYDLNFYFDEKNTFNVWLKKRNGISPLISKENGLIGYPVFAQSGILFNAFYSPMLSAGREVQLITDLPNATGTYMLTSVNHALSAWVPGGQWQSVCQGIRKDNSNAR